MKIFSSHRGLSDFAASQIVETIKAKPNAVLCLATGETPKLTYQILANRITEEKIDVSQVSFFGLDEWAGIGPENSGSCRYFLNLLIFDPLKISTERIFCFDALAVDLNAECKLMNEAIYRLGGFDLMLTGVGMNGHIGFNEPGVLIDKHAHVAKLDNITKEVGQKYFSGATELSKGLTFGFLDFFLAKKVLVLANGEKKSSIIKSAVEGSISNFLPASLIRQHNNGLLLLDSEAASKLQEKVA